MIVRDHPALSLSRQCRLLSLGRSSLYYEPKGESAGTLALMRRISGAPASDSTSRTSSACRGRPCLANRQADRALLAAHGSGASGPDAPHRQRFEAPEHDALAKLRAGVEHVHLREPLE